MASLKAAVVQSVETSSPRLEEMTQVWKRIGLDETQMENRKSHLVLHFTNLLKDIAMEEVELEKSMINSIEISQTELSSLCEQLGLPPDQVCG